MSLISDLCSFLSVKAIDPGTVPLPENASETNVQWAEQNPLLQRVGTPEDLASTAPFLTETDFVTSAVYLVDGGRALV